MSYKRRSPWQSSYGGSYSSTTKVSIHWSNKSVAYAIKFSDTHNWTQMQILIGYLKNIPYGERDYDPDNKIWFLVEKHIDAFKEMVTALNQYFELDFVAKPLENQQTFQHFVSTDVLLDKFKKYTNENIKDIDYSIAKKIYLKWIMRNHPDKGGDKNIASEVNSIWSDLEKLYFKVKKETEYATI